MMEVFMIALFTAAVLGVIWGFLSGEMSRMAEAKGYSRRRYWHICFWLGIVGFLIVIAMPDLKAREQRERLIAALEANKAPMTLPPM